MNKKKRGCVKRRLSDEGAKKHVSSMSGSAGSFLSGKRMSMPNFGT
jgi:hypothetical protein